MSWTAPAPPKRGCTWTPTDSTAATSHHVWLTSYDECTQTMQASGAAARRLASTVPLPTCADVTQVTCGPIASSAMISIVLPCLLCSEGADGGGGGTKGTCMYTVTPASAALTAACKLCGSSSQLRVAGRGLCSGHRDHAVTWLLVSGTGALYFLLCIVPTLRQRAAIVSNMMRSSSKVLAGLVRSALATSRASTAAVPAAAIAASSLLLGGQATPGSAFRAFAASADSKKMLCFQVCSAPPSRHDCQILALLSDGRRCESQTWAATAFAVRANCQRHRLHHHWPGEQGSMFRALARRDCTAAADGSAVPDILVIFLYFAVWQDPRGRRPAGPAGVHAQGAGHACRQGSCSRHRG